MNGMSRQLCTFVVSLMCVVLTQGCASSGFSGRSHVDYDSIGIVTRDATKMSSQFPNAKQEIDSCLRMGLLNRGFHVVERDRMQDALDEISFAGKGITKSNALELGNAVSAQALLLVDVSGFGIRKPLIKTIGERIPWPNDGSTLSSDFDDVEVYEATVKILVRLVDTEKMQSNWSGAAKATAFVPSLTDLGDAHVSAAREIADKLPRKTREKVAEAPTQ